MGSLSRNKGHNYERTVAQWYRDLGLSAKRGLQSRDGREVGDIITDLPLAIECKHYRSLGLTSRAFKQAQACSPDTLWIPVVHLHEDRGPHLVVTDAGNWVGRILKCAIRGGLFGEAN